MAREVLDVQKYPDLRQYPGGPPERPYDAAGWTLPLQMGVRVVAAATPLTRRRAREDEAARPRCPIRRSSRRRTTRRCRPMRRRSTACRAPASTPSPAAAAIVPPPGRITGTGPVAVARSGAEQRVPRDQSRVEGRRDGAVAPARRARRSLRHRGLADARAGRAREVARARRRAHRSAPGRADAASRASASISRGAAAWTRAGRAGCSSSTASTSSPLHPADFKSPLAEKVDVADPGRRCAGAGRGRGGGRGGRGGGGARCGRSTPITLTRRRSAGVRAVRPRRRHASSA